MPLATLFTITTYGTWLRGDTRGWVDNGITFPPDPILEAHDQATMKEPPYLFAATDRLSVGEAIGQSLIDRLDLHVLALCVESWHCHFVIGPTEHDIAKVVKCAKDAARWKLRIDRRIWGTGYDKRFCFDEAAVRTRIDYVEKHNLRNGLPAKPWGFISSYISPA
jgi:hypothetical protein